jgi:hypothetical protein
MEFNVCLKELGAPIRILNITPFSLIYVLTFRHTDVSNWCGLQAVCINMTRNNELEGCKTTDCVHSEPLTMRCDVIQIMLY